jgi:hypothetical protein
MTSRSSLPYKVRTALLHIDIEMIAPEVDHDLVQLPSDSSARTSLAVTNSPTTCAPMPLPILQARFSHRAPLGGSGSRESGYKRRVRRCHRSERGFAIAHPALSHASSAPRDCGTLAPFLDGTSHRQREARATVAASTRECAARNFLSTASRQSESAVVVGNPLSDQCGARTRDRRGAPQTQRLRREESSDLG